MMLAGLAAVAGIVVTDPWLRLGLSGTRRPNYHSAGLAMRANPLGKADLPRGRPHLGCVFSRQRLVNGDADRPIGRERCSSPAFCVKLAAVPLFFWLLRLADELPALVLGLIIAVVDMAAFGEFYDRGSDLTRSVRAPQGFWLGVAAATSFIAALLMLTQRSLKRLLVLSTVEDVGFLLLGLASHDALWDATAHCLPPPPTRSPRRCSSSASAVLKPPAHSKNESTGLATRYPVSAFGFLFGMLAMLGVPPLLGFIGRWRLYETALQISPGRSPRLHPLVHPRAHRLRTGSDPHLVGTATTQTRLRLPDSRNGTIPAPGHDRCAGRRCCWLPASGRSCSQCCKGGDYESLESIDVLLAAAAAPGSST